MKLEDLMNSRRLDEDQIAAAQELKDRGFLTIQDVALSIGEPAFTLISSTIAEPVSGLAGIAGTAYGGLGTGSRWIENVQDAMTYKPETEAGMAGLNNLGRAADWALGWIGRGAEKIGDATFDATGSPAAATAVRMIPEGLSEILPGPNLTKIGKKAGAGIGIISDNGVVSKRAGVPLDVYHGTNADFEVFDKSFGGQNWGDESSKMGFFFTSSPKAAWRYGDRVVKANIKSGNPKIVDAEQLIKDEYEYLVRRGEFSGEFDDFVNEYLDGDPYGFYETGQLNSDIKEAISSGNDSLVVDFGNISTNYDGRGADRGGVFVVPFESSQITQLDRDYK